MRTILITIALAATLHADDIPVKELKAGKDDRKEYCLIGDTAAKKPKAGFGLVIVMPGGGGGRDFHEFVKSIAAEALPAGYLVVQPIAFKWNQTQEIVWPLDVDKKNNHIAGMTFSTEEFIDAIITDVTAAHVINPQRIFTLSWSSSGPAAYAIALANPKVTGSFIAMSVFHPDRVGAHENAKDKPFFLYHSPEDKVCKYKFAKDAKAALVKHGAAVTIVEYDGGHGWNGATMDDIRTGIDWLASKATAPKLK